MCCGSTLWWAWASEMAKLGVNNVALHGVDRRAAHMVGEMPDSADVASGLAGVAEGTSGVALLLDGEGADPRVHSGEAGAFL